MESKPLRRAVEGIMPVFMVLLLIEPVWNRNVTMRLHGLENLSYSGAFNRTSMESKLEASLTHILDLVRTLLIEPVWNRNTYLTYKRNTCVAVATFNRTSMESKRYPDLHVGLC